MDPFSRVFMDTTSSRQSGRRHAPCFSSGELSEKCGSRLSLVFRHAREKVLCTVSLKRLMGKHLDTATGLGVASYSGVHRVGS